jgi:hypothetical protein
MERTNQFCFFYITAIYRRCNLLSFLTSVLDEGCIYSFHNVRKVNSIMNSRLCVCASTCFISEIFFRGGGHFRFPKEFYFCTLYSLDVILISKLGRVSF